MSKKINFLQSDEVKFLFERRMLTTKEAAFYLGLSVITVRRKAGKGVFPLYRPNGGKLYFEISDLYEYLLSKRRSSVEKSREVAATLNFKNSKKMEDLMFNEYKKFFDSSSVEISEKEIIEKIGSGFGIKGKIEKIRKEILKNGKSDISNKLKTELPAFIIAGSFSNGGRSKNNLLSYYGWMIFDIDNIKSDEQYKKIFNKLIKYPFVRTVFRSPSGNGMKIIVVTDNKDSGKHTELYKKLMKHLESELNVKFDSTCDVNRLCYYTYDPDIYHNENSQIFEFESSEENFSEEESGEIFETQFVKEMKYIIYFTNNVSKFEKGNRNKYIYLLGENSNGFGMDKKVVIEYCIMKFMEDEFSEYEIQFALEKGYSSEKYEFGQWRPKLLRDIKKDIGKNEVRVPSEISVVEKFSSKLDTNFSQKYKDVLNQLKTENDKDKFILGMITVLESIYKTE